MQSKGLQNKQSVNVKQEDVTSFEKPTCNTVALILFLFFSKCYTFSEITFVFNVVMLQEERLVKHPNKQFYVAATL